MADFRSMKKKSEIATLVQVGKSILEWLASETLPSSHKAQKLSDPVSSICQLLLQAIKKDVDSEIPKSWIREVSKALYEASDLVDEAVADGAALAASSSLVSKVRFRSLFGLSSSSNTSSTSIFGVRMGPVVNRLCKTLDLLKQEDLGLGLEGEHQTLMTESCPVIATANNMMNIVGRGHDKKVISNVLLDTSDLDQHISVVSIVGVGGIGKTTLAKHIYDDERILAHFDRKFWVSVGSDESDIKDIIKSIISSSSITDSSVIDKFDMKQLEDLLMTEISKKVYFLVLDDVWNLSQEMWSNLESLLMKGARGSKILVTTRSQQVADISQSYFVHPLGGLSLDASWFLFKNIAFGLQEFPDNLEYIGNKILVKCKGVPLAVTAIANILREKTKTLEEWRRIEESDLWTIIHSNPLILSYKHLPPPLKVCFTYCSLIPEEFEISISDLVSLWMAQGYIEHGDSQDDLEDIAMRYFLMLSNNYFFINKEKDEFGNIKACWMQELMHDLAKRVAGKWGTMTHLSHIQGRDDAAIPYKDEGKLLSFLRWTVVGDEEGPAGKIGINDIVEMSRFKSLRVLDLHAYGLKVLPDSIGNLVHLRYLDFSHNEALLKLPTSIANLYHLQTLILNFCYELEELPASIGKLVCLRRLEIDGCEKLTFMPPGLKNLTSLRTLSRFVVGRPHFQFGCGFEAVGNLNHLRGRLMIELSDNWTIAVKLMQISTRCC